jgi:hypothetical protein
MGRCSLLPDDLPTDGTLVGGTHSLLKYDTLTLALPDGRQLSIEPKRIEHRPGEPPLLVFAVLG